LVAHGRESFYSVKTIRWSSESLIPIPETQSAFRRRAQ
jgi:hypothetical protein